MKSKFEIKAWLSENRESIISKHESLTKEKFYNGITLKNFMMTVMIGMINNNVKSDKVAQSKLPHVMGMIYVDNSRILGDDVVTMRLQSKYTGTSYMAMV